MQENVQSNIQNVSHLEEGVNLLQTMERPGKFNGKSGEAAELFCREENRNSVILIWILFVRHQENGRSPAAHSGWPSYPDLINLIRPDFELD
jgi:hypothetical protein